MAASRRLPKHLNNVLGADAGAELVTLLDELRAENAHFRRVLERRFDSIDHRFDSIDHRFDAVDKRFAEVDKRFAGVDARFDRMDTRFTALEVRVADAKADLMKWSFAFWIGSVVAIAVLAKLIR